MSIELNNQNAMHSLAWYYYTIEKNNDLVEKYYIMASELNDLNAIHNLGSYYADIKNYDLMKKYYLMAIELKNKVSVFNLKYYFKYIENNPSNYYKYIYYKRILTLIISINKLNKKNRNKNCINMFLPEEILTLIFNEYIIEID